MGGIVDRRVFSLVDIVVAVSAVVSAQFPVAVRTVVLLVVD